MPPQPPPPQNSHAPNGDLAPAPVPTTPSPNISAQDTADLAAIESSIARMRAFTPTDPYFLTIPQQEPRYHHSYAYQARQWLHQTPFEAREHELTQYQTFVYREPGRDMFMLHNSRWEEEEVDEANYATVSGEGRTPVPSSHATGGTAPKKTISLSAYTKKQTGGTPDAAAATATSTAARKEKEREAEVVGKKPAVKGPAERIKADEEVLAAVEDAGEDGLGSVGLEEGKKDLKRKRGDGEAVEREKDEARNGEDDAPAKKARRASPPPRAQPPPTAKQPTDSKQAEPAAKPPPKSPSQSTSDTTRLPPKLSPPHRTPEEETALPPKLSPMETTTEIPQLPSRLSPTIPSNIIATLNARAHYRSVSRSSEIAPGSRSASKDPATRHMTPPPKTIPRNAFRANSSSPAVRSDLEERGRQRQPLSVPPQRPKTLTPSPKDRVGEEDAAHESDEIPVGKKAEKVKRQRESVSDASSARLIVRLKFKKAQREAVRRILRMRPDPKPGKVFVAKDEEEEGEDEVGEGRRRASKSSLSTASDVRGRGRRDTNAKGVAQKVGPSTATATAANGVARKERDVDSASPERKRPRLLQDETDDSDIPAKIRKKSEDAAGELSKKRQRSPSTPHATDLLSPSSAQKGNTSATAAAAAAVERNQLTPSGSTMRKDVLSAAMMKREHSTDSRLNTPPPHGGADTSQASPTVNGTHNGTTSQHTQQQNAANGSSRAAPAAPSTKTPKQLAWETEQRRLETLGRELKHAASDHLGKSKSNSSASSPGTPPTTNNHANNADESAQTQTQMHKHKKLAALKSLNSLLLYILAFTCADNAAHAALPPLAPSTKTWRSLLGFFGFVKKLCEPFPPLGGVACWVGVVFNARILEIATGVSSTSGSGSGGGEAGGGGGGGGGSAMSREALLEVQAMLQRAAHEAEGKLDFDALVAHFPRTWEGRARGPTAAAETLELPLPQGEETVKGRAWWEGEYKLPLGVQSSTLVAARAGVALLGEWGAKEGKGLGWEVRS